MFSDVRFSSRFPLQFTIDLQGNSKGVIEKLRDSRPKFVKIFLDWLKNNEQWGKHNLPVLKEVYVFIKFNVSDMQILTRIDEINQRILKIDDNNVSDWVPNEDRSYIVNRDLQILEDYLGKLSETQKFKFFSKNAEGRTPFHECLKHIPRIVLLEKNCPIKLRQLMFTKDNNGRTPFHEDIKDRNAAHQEFLEFIVERCPKELLPTLFERDSEGNSPLEKLCCNGVAKILKIALTTCPEKTLDDQILNFEESMFSYALICNRKITARVLLENTSAKYKVKLFQEDKFARTPLHVLLKIFKEDDLELLKSLLQHCPPSELPKLFQKSKDNYDIDLGFSPLEFAKQTYPNNKELHRILEEYCPKS